MKGQNAALAPLETRLAEAELTQDGADDRAAMANLRDHFEQRAAKLRDFLNTPDLDEEQRTAAQNELTSALQSQKSYIDRLKDGAGPIGELETAQADKYKRMYEDSQRVLADSQAQYAVLNGPGDIGFSQGANAAASAGGITYNINALSGNDPAIQRAMAAASNGGNAMGGNADRMYSGRQGVGL